MQLNYTIRGKENGKKIVLVHGWAKAASIESLAKLQDELVEKDFHVWNIELPGFGKSKKAPDDWGTPEFAKEIAIFIKTKVLGDGDKEYYLFGHSFGGSIGAYISANLQPKPTKLILCSTAGLRYKTLKAWILLPFAKILKIFLLVFPKGLREKIRRNVYYYLIRERDYVDTADKKEQFIKITNQDLKETFKRIRIPTLIIWGKDDKITPLKMGEKINKLVDGSKLEVIEGKHGVPITRTGKVAGLINKFL